MTQSYEPKHPATLESARVAPEGARVLIVDADPALCGLLDEWLAAFGCSSIAEEAIESSPSQVDLIIADVPFPREQGPNVLKRLTMAHPGVPIVMLSSAFFAGIESSGPVAKRLSVAGVLPKPLARDALIAVIGRLLHDG